MHVREHFIKIKIILLCCILGGTPARYKSIPKSIVLSVFVGMGVFAAVEMWLRTITEIANSITKVS